jgi:hypothetical protein
LPTVLKETGFTCEASLNAKIGGNADEFIDLKNEVIHSPTDRLCGKILRGFQKTIERRHRLTALSAFSQSFTESPCLDVKASIAERKLACVGRVLVFSVWGRQSNHRE